MAGSLAKSVPRSELVNERQGRAAIAEPFAHVEPEHTVEAGQRETQPTADIDIVLTIRLGPPFDVGGVGKHGGTDLGERLQHPPLPHFTRDVGDTTSESIGLQHPIVDDRMRSKE